MTGNFDSDSSEIWWVTFSSRGLPKDGTTAKSGIFSICSYDNTNAIIDSRAVVLGLSGRVRVSDSAVKKCPATP